jgi:hypothetical protein
MTPLFLAAHPIPRSLAVMKELKYDHAIWQRIQADRDHAMANPGDPRPNWMIGRPGSPEAFWQGYTYVVYRKSVPLRPLSYGSQENINIMLSPFVRAMLDIHVYARARRVGFVTGQGAIRAIRFSEIIDYLLSIKKPPSPPQAP